MAWLGILAESTPAAPEGMYCPHPNGLSVHSMRGPGCPGSICRCRPTPTSETGVIRRSGTSCRCAAPPPTPSPGDRSDRRKVPGALRSYVCSTMQYKRLFLAGDAAHIVPPTGAKGLNLAILDTCVLSHALGAAINHGITEHLTRYTATALPASWPPSDSRHCSPPRCTRCPATDSPRPPARDARSMGRLGGRSARARRVYLGLPSPLPRPSVPDRRGERRHECG